MTITTYAIAIVLFFIAAILQASFLPSFSLFSTVPDLIFAIFFILIFFEDKHQYQDGFFLAIMAGFFTDVFSRGYFGISMVTLLAVYFLEKIIMRFLRQGRDSYPVFYFVSLFFACFFANQAVHALLFELFGFPSTFGVTAITGAIYSSIIAIAGFYVYKTYIKREKRENQLKLL